MFKHFFKDIINYVNTTKYDKCSLATTDIKTKTGFFINLNNEWVNTYIENKLYLEDPLIIWEDKVIHYLINSKINKTFFKDFNELHCCENGYNFREIRSKYSINSGGITVTKYDDIFITMLWWSSNKETNFIDDYSCVIKRNFFLEIEKKFIEIYYKNYNLIFKGKKINNNQITIDI